MRLLFVLLFSSLLSTAAHAELFKRTVLFRCDTRVHQIEIQKWDWVDGVSEYGLYFRDRGTGLVLFDNSAWLVAAETGIQFESKYSPNGSVPALLLHLKTGSTNPDGSFTARYKWSHDSDFGTATSCLKAS